MKCILGILLSSKSSGVIDGLRGTYLGAAEENTVYRNPYSAKSI